MNNAEYTAALAACNWRDGEAVSKLVTSSYTNVKFNEKVTERQTQNIDGAYNYYSGFFGKEVWPDGQGLDEIREYYVPNHIPITFAYFVRMSEICDPNLADNCRYDYCEVPQGGRGTLPQLAFWKWNIKTPRDCIANIRSISQFRYWAKKIITDRERMDESLMNMFYVMAAIKTTGQKITMQGVRGADTLLRLAPSNDPRNPLRGGYFNYMEEKFPSPTDLADIVPITPDTLEGLARYWDQFPVNNNIAARGSRGEPIYEFWYGDDWYRQVAIQDPDHVEKIKLTAPWSMFGGYSNKPGDREYVGNFAAKQMRWLPRFAPTADGKIIPVDTAVGVDIEVGKEYLPSQQFQDAPYGLALMPSGKQATILSRPSLTESGAGFPIVPITGDSPWRIRNEYDAECNPEQNMPYSTKHYEFGMRMDDPTAAIAFLYRRPLFTTRPINECDLAPVFYIEEPTVDCELNSIGCSSGKRRENNDITQNGNFTHVNCTAAVCGNTGSAPFQYIVTIDRKANEVGYNSLGCDCGSNVKLYIYDDNGDYVKEMTGVVKNDMKSYPYAKYVVQTTVALTTGQCIKGIACADATPLAGNVNDAFDIVDPETQEIVTGEVGFFLDGSIACVGSDVIINYYTSAGVLIAAINGSIEEFNPETFFYRISSTNPAFMAEAYPNQASIEVICD